MQADLTVRIDGTPTQVLLGENTALTFTMAGRAAASQAAAANSAALAEAFTGKVYSDVPAAEAATAEGEAFAVQTATPGVIEIYTRTAGGSDFLRTALSGEALSSDAGASLVGTKRDALAMPELLDIVINRQDFYPQTYGAAADGATDDAAAIQTAIDRAYASRGRVMFEGEYAFASQLEFSAAMGVKPGSRLICPEDYDDSGVGTAQRTAIINKGFALAYNPATALPIVIEDPLEIVIRATTNHQLLTLANVSRVEMNAPKFWTETTARCDALIDFYACWRNVDLYSPDLANTTGASGGAAAWIRNITTDGSNSENDAFGLRWHGGELRHNTGDEALAVYGVLGATHDVTIKDLAVKALEDAATGTRHSTLISCFPLNNGGSASVAQGDLNAAVYNVLFDNLTIEDARFRDHVFRTGRGEDKYNPCHDITLQRSWIKAKQASVRTSHIMRHVPNVGGNVCIDDVTAIGDATGEAITYGALDFDLVTNSDITGNVDRAVARTSNTAMAVKRNKRLIGNVYGVDDAVVVEHNEEISGAAYAVQLRSSLTYRIAASALRVRNTSGTAAGVLVNSIGGAASPAGVIDQVTLTSNNPSAVLATTSGAIGAVDLLRSRGLGTGFTGLSSAFRAVEGNNRFGSPDPMGRTIVLGDAAAVLTSAPMQLVMHDAALTANREVSLPTTGVLDGHVVRYLRLPAAGTTYTTTVTGAATGPASFTGAGGAQFVRSGGAWKREPVLT